MAGLTSEAVRTLVVWCPDWPLTSLGVDPKRPAVVLNGDRVRASSLSARLAGISLGQRRHDAQAQCPDLIILESNEAQEVCKFESVVVALRGITPWIKVRRPGVCAFGVGGLHRLFSEEHKLVNHTAKTVNEVLTDVLGTGLPLCRIGVADGLFAAGLAARTAAWIGAESMIVPVDGTPTFLSTQPVEVLSQPRLTDVLLRLGLTTLGVFADLPANKVISRFGPEGLMAHRLASGTGDYLSECKPAFDDLSVTMDLDPPVDHSGQLAFSAQSLVESFCDCLLQRGLDCTRMVVEVETVHGERLEKWWWVNGTLGDRTVIDRIRRQLEGWLCGSSAIQLTAGLTRLTLRPDEVLATTSHQTGFWNAELVADQRAERSLTRIAELLGPRAVRVPVWHGGRDPADQLALVPFPSMPDRSVEPTDNSPPWPGSLPNPSPAAVHVDPKPVEMFAATGQVVRVDGRGQISAPPASLRLGNLSTDPILSVVAWSGPWPLEERWWDPDRRRRRARLQVVTIDGTARLVELANGQWRIGATYD